MHFQAQASELAIKLATHLLETPADRCLNIGGARGRHHQQQQQQQPNGNSNSSNPATNRCDQTCIFPQ